MSDSVPGPRAYEINVLVVIDTEYLKSTYSNPSKDHNNPTAIDHARQFMLCTGSRGVVSGQGSGDLEFKANPGDNITFTGVSIYNNADDAVIVYDLKHFCGEQVLSRFIADMIVRTGAVQANADSPNRNGLPPVKKQANFAVFDSKIRANGREGLGLAFGLYTLAANGQNQELYGYFWWDPYITIAG